VEASGHLKHEKYARADPLERTDLGCDALGVKGQWESDFVIERSNLRRQEPMTHKADL
jgi:hypothetical protein